MQKIFFIPSQFNKVKTSQNTVKKIKIGWLKKMYLKIGWLALLYARLMKLVPR